ncbi:YiiD C-terminal domain-containing protein [Kribbella deserti]|uniref:YiiD C-terminal domain-containing protein n=1 Tax=Kribbella deserti TaxID=1926257 RepID=A0ABV6QGP2_9ACTN
MNAGIEHMVPVAHRMGIRIIEVLPGRVVGEVGLEGNTNHLGTMYAGVIFSAAEIIGGVLSIATFDAERFYPIVKTVRIRYRRPATGTVRAATWLDTATIASVREEATANAKADFALDALLTDESGEVIATTQADYQLVRHGS